MTRTRNQKIETYIETHGKSMGMAVLLALLLGPIGLLYASVLGGVILCLAVFIAAFNSPAAASYIGIGAWLFSILLAPAAVYDKNKALRAQAELMTPEEA